MFWKNRSVLVTGHTGFKGTWLTLYLLRLGAKVYGLSVSAEPYHLLYKACRPYMDIQENFVDIRDAEDLSLAIQSLNPEVVFHMAAQAFVLTSYEDPATTFDVNVQGTVNVIEACRHQGSLKALIQITSDKVYALRPYPHAFSEDDFLAGKDPYSMSKVCMEHVIATYHHMIPDFPMAVARSGNVVGGGDFSPNRLIPDIVRAYETNVPLLIRNPYALRPWQHVLDPLHGYIRLAEHVVASKYQGAWNFGPDAAKGFRVNQVIESFEKNWGMNVLWAHDTTLRGYESPFLRLSSAKAQQYLSWSPRWPFSETMYRTASWYKQWLLGDVPYLLCQRDLDAFLNGEIQLKNEIDDAMNVETF